MCYSNRVSFGYACFEDSSTGKAFSFAVKINKDMLHSTTKYITPQVSYPTNRDLFRNRSWPLWKTAFCSQWYYSPAVFKVNNRCKLNAKVLMPADLRLYSTWLTFFQTLQLLILLFLIQNNMKELRWIKTKPYANRITTFLMWIQILIEEEDTCRCLQSNSAGGYLTWSHLKGSAVASVKEWSFEKKMCEAWKTFIDASMEL